MLYVAIDNPGAQNQYAIIQTKEYSSETMS